MLEKINYDKSNDSAYLKITVKRVFKTKEVTDGVLIDYDSNGEIIGIEILDFNKRINKIGGK